MGNFDTMNLNNYREDIYFLTGGYQNKINKLLNNLYFLITLEILASLEAIADLHSGDTSQIFNNQEMKTHYKWLKANMNTEKIHDAYAIVKKPWNI